MAQTSDGYLWLTSTSGLLRFDGVRFVEWSPPGHESLPGQPLNSLLGSKDGSLWIGGDDSRTHLTWGISPISPTR